MRMLLPTVYKLRNGMKGLTVANFISGVLQMQIQNIAPGHQQDVAEL